MHEAGIVEDLIIAVQDAMKDKDGFTKIRKIHLKLGRHGHATEDSIRHWFDHIRHDHADEYPEFSDAELEIVMTEGEELSVSSVDYD